MSTKHFFYGIVFFNVFLKQDINTSLEITLNSMNRDIFNTIDKYGKKDSKLDCYIGDLTAMKGYYSLCSEEFTKYDMLTALQTFYVSYPLALTCKGLYQAIHPESTCLSDGTLCGSQILDTLCKKLTNDPVFIEMWWDVPTLSIAKILHDDEYYKVNQELSEELLLLLNNNEYDYFLRLNEQIWDEKKFDIFCTFQKRYDTKTMYQYIFSCDEFFNYVSQFAQNIENSGLIAIVLNKLKPIKFQKLFLQYILSKKVLYAANDLRIQVLKQILRGTTFNLAHSLCISDELKDEFQDRFEESELMPLELTPTHISQIQKLLNAQKEDGSNVVHKHVKRYKECRALFDKKFK